jgi:hypothetical protein
MFTRRLAAAAAALLLAAVPAAAQTRVDLALGKSALVNPIPFPISPSRGTVSVGVILRTERIAEEQLGTRIAPGVRRNCATG